MFQNLTQDPSSARKVAGAHLNNSEMGFAQIEDTLTKLLTIHTLTPLTLCLTGPRGSGKSFFLNNLQTKLESQATVITINLWEWDYAPEPLHVLFAELIAKSQSSTEKWTKNVKQASTILLKTLGSFSLTALNNPLVNELIKTITQSKTPPLPDKQLLFQQLQSHKKALRDALTNAAEKKPIVIILDELDRCKPDFALLTLERIKHYLNIPNLKVVLGCNLPQLHISIKHVYGTDTASEEYLRRLIDYQFTLPEPELSGIITRCLNSSKIEGFDHSKILSILQIFNNLSDPPRIRDFEQILGHFFFLYQIGTTPPPDWNDGYFPLLFLCLAKVKSFQLFNLLKDEINTIQSGFSSPNLWDSKFSCPNNWVDLFYNRYLESDVSRGPGTTHVATYYTSIINIHILKPHVPHHPHSVIALGEGGEQEFGFQLIRIDERLSLHPQSCKNLAGYLPTCLNALAHLTLPQPDKQMID